MKLLLDQGLPRGAVPILRTAAFEVAHVGDIGMSRASDDEILAEALRIGAVVITLDADFHALLALAHAPGPSVVRLRVEGLDAAGAASLIERVVRSAAPAIDAGAVVTATSTVARVRLLPIG